jgi:hypothetical protein
MASAVLLDLDAQSLMRQSSGLAELLDIEGDARAERRAQQLDRHGA